MSLEKDRNLGGTCASYRKLGDCTRGKALRTHILAKKDKNELLIIKMVSRTNLGYIWCISDQNKRGGRGSLMLELKTLVYKWEITAPSQNHNRGAHPEYPFTLLPIFLGLQLWVIHGVLNERSSALSPDTKLHSSSRVHTTPSGRSGQLQTSLVSEGERLPRLS